MSGIPTSSRGPPPLVIAWIFVAILTGGMIAVPMGGRARMECTAMRQRGYAPERELPQLDQESP